MDVAQEDLDRIARFCDEARRAASRAEALLGLDDNHLRHDIRMAKREASNALTEAVRAGATKPETISNLAETQHQEVEGPRGRGEGR